MKTFHSNLLAFSSGKQEATAIAQEVEKTRRLEQATGEQDQSALWKEKVKFSMARKFYYTSNEPASGLVS